MTPAEKLAKSKPKKSQKPARSSPWVCLITAARKDLGLTLDEVAEATGLSKTTIWDVEHGQDPLLTTAHTLAEFYGRTIDQLWSRQMDG